MSQGEEGKQKALGCLAIIAIGVVIGVGSSVWGWITDAGSDKVDMVVYAEINQSMIGTLRLGSGCDMSGYDLEVLDENGRAVASKNLGKGLADRNGVFCSFLVRLEVPSMDEYRLFIPIHSGDTRISSKTVSHVDALTPDGDLDIEIRWYNHVDGD